MIYVYAIGDRQASTGAEVDAIAHGEVAAFVKRDVARAPAPDRDSLLQHDSVVFSLMDGGGAVLPMRFGSVVGEEGELRELLTQRRDDLERRLEHVRGRVEFGVRATWRSPRPVAEDAPNGHAFMLAKLRARSAARWQLEELTAPLAELAIDTKVSLCPSDDTAFSTAYLVDRAHASRFEQRARRAAGGADEVTLALSGPWPPYSFSGSLDG
ncbi:MAG: hypothetical protein QOI19_48 [Thermoleophilaceae bacterium]|nr:hypothetical protein [Thermoleophilaceae bacterium]